MLSKSSIDGKDKVSFASSEQVCFALFAILICFDAFHAYHEPVVILIYRIELRYTKKKIRCKGNSFAPTSPYARDEVRSGITYTSRLDGLGK